MAYNIGHASIGEKGGRGNTAGDQTGREVYIRTFYDYPFNVILRPISNADAEKIASNMEALCANSHVGYDMNDRLTAYYVAKNVGYDLSKISTDVETDCSAAVALCCIAAGINVNPSMTTYNEKAALLATGKFTDVSSSVAHKPANMRRGDVLVNELHHTAIFLSTPRVQATGGGFMAYCVNVTASDYLQMRTTPGGTGTATEYKLNGQSARLPHNMQVAIVEEKVVGGATWGRVGNTDAWISLKYAAKV